MFFNLSIKDLLEQALNFIQKGFKKEAEERLAAANRIILNYKIPGQEKLIEKHLKEIDRLYKLIN